ncbi:MAG: PD-(D/E)XK nuclease family protein [Candidatus Melainabacteria bacterium]|nr:MAG: PD-(D/E)XK nuclease family protein [Candidatus Melainabacteria bacterium]
MKKNKDGTFELYDYKTGTPVSAKKVEIGESREDYFNQLCFYKYAFEKLTNKKVSKVGLIYIENHSKTIYKELGQNDMEYIENLITKAYKDIKDLQFNETAKSNDTCKYCAYKQICKLEIL